MLVCEIYYTLYTCSIRMMMMMMTMVMSLARPVSEVNYIRMCSLAEVV